MRWRTSAGWWPSSSSALNPALSSTMRRSPGRPRWRRKMQGCRASWTPHGSARRRVPRSCARFPRFQAMPSGRWRKSSRSPRACSGLPVSASGLPTTANGAARFMSAAAPKPSWRRFPTRSGGSAAAICRVPSLRKTARFTSATSTISIPPWPTGRACRLPVRPARKPFRHAVAARGPGHRRSHYPSRHAFAFHRGRIGAAAEFRRSGGDCGGKRAAVQRSHARRWNGRPPPRTSCR